MFGDIPEFGNNEEAEVFANCWSHSDLLLPPDHRSQKRPGRSTHPGSRFDPHMAITSSSHPGSHSKILSAS